MKRSFSLTEIVVACLILAIAATLCLLNLKGSIEDRERRLAFEQVQRKLELAKLLSFVMRDRIYFVAIGSLPAKITLDTASRRSAQKANILFQFEELKGVSDVVWGVNNSSAGEVRIAFCNGIPILDTNQNELLLQFKNTSKNELSISLEKESTVQLMSPEEIERIFPKELINMPSEVK